MKSEENCPHAEMVHRPDERMFYKKPVVLANAIGPLNNGPRKDIATSLSWLGVSDIKMLGIGLMEGVIWNEVKNELLNLFYISGRRYGN